MSQLKNAIGDAMQEAKYKLSHMMYEEANKAKGLTGQYQCIFIHSFSYYITSIYNVNGNL